MGALTWPLQNIPPAFELFLWSSCLMLGLLSCWKNKCSPKLYITCTLCQIIFQGLVISFCFHIPFHLDKPPGPAAEKHPQNILPPPRFPGWCPVQLLYSQRAFLQHLLAAPVYLRLSLGFQENRGFRFLWTIWHGSASQLKAFKPCRTSSQRERVLSHRVNGPPPFHDEVIACFGADGVYSVSYWIQFHYGQSGHSFNICFHFLWTSLMCIKASLYCFCFSWIV